MGEKEALAIREAQAFIALHRAAVLMTFRKDGKPQLSPISAVPDGDGRIVVSTPETTAKVRNVRRNPFAAVCVWSAWPGPWVQIEGPAEVLSGPDAIEPLVDLHRRSVGETDWQEYRDYLVADKRVLIRITIDHASPITWSRLVPGRARPPRSVEQIRQQDRLAAEGSSSVIL